MFAVYISSVCEAHVYFKSMDIWCTILTTGLLDSTYFCIRLWLHFDCKNNPWPPDRCYDAHKKADCTVCKIIQAQQYRWFIVVLYCMYVLCCHREATRLKKRLKATKQKKQTREQETGDTMLICNNNVNFDSTIIIIIVLLLIIYYRFVLQLDDDTFETHIFPKYKPCIMSNTSWL